MTATTTTDCDSAVFATTVDGKRVRVTDPTAWHLAQHTWRNLDSLRQARRFPHVKFFEVRSMFDPGYKDSPVSFAHGEPLDKARTGYRRYEDAARAAWVEWQGQTFTDRRGGFERRQGVGGWFFWRNGQTAAQGLRGLASLACRRGLVLTGTDGRYYPNVRSL